MWLHSCTGYCRIRWNLSSNKKEKGKKGVRIPQYRNTIGDRIIFTVEQEVVNILPYWCTDKICRSYPLSIISRLAFNCSFTCNLHKQAELLLTSLLFLLYWAVSKETGAWSTVTRYARYCGFCLAPPAEKRRYRFVGCSDKITSLGMHRTCSTELLVIFPYPYPKIARKYSYLNLI